MVWHFIGVYIINRTLHGRLEIRNFSSRVEKNISLIRFTHSWNTLKFRKYAPGLIFFKGPFWGAYFWRGLSTEGNLHFKIDWASLIAGDKCAIFALFYYIFEGNFPSTSPWRAYIWRGDLTEGFLCLVWGAYTWRGLFLEFYGNFQHSKRNFVSPPGHVISSIYYTSTLYSLSVFSLAKSLRLILEISKS